VRPLAWCSRPRSESASPGGALIPINRHRLWQLGADALLIALAWYAAWIVRFDSLDVPVFYEPYLSWETILLVVGIKLTIFVGFGFYNRWWRYVSMRDMWRAALGAVVASLATYLLFYFVSIHEVRLPRSVAALDVLLLLGFVATSRMLARTVIERPAPGSLVAHGKEVLVVGAGDAGQLVIREMLKSRAYTPIGLIDDDPRKKNLRVHGIRVLGTSDELPHILRDRKPDELLIAIPSASGEVRQRIVNAARDGSVAVKTLPGLYELISGDHDLAAQIRPVQVEDVLGREPIEVDLEAISSYLAGETVLVTGAGGSIGAELCRQIARTGPQRLILVDLAETAMFEIERELVDERGFPAAVPVLADVGNRQKMRQLFERYRPGVVFHAAAYKHVPLMEANPLESVRNNVLGTKVVADVAAEYGARRFVLISTDKALNPSAVYGQCKGICEWIVEAYGARRDVPTSFTAVRFGNVLGSSGSVIPIFRRQIAKGGPVTVTHPEMTRYFMTIPESVSLVIQAGAIGGRGEIFVLDMGEPVKILELARNMIRLSGKEPDRDVPIEFIGARAGEKLHEELWGRGETVGETSHPKIKRATRSPIDAAWLDDELAVLGRLVEEGETLELVSRLSAIVREPRRVAVHQRETVS
jgi:FlaA1/EpsC-like NDP-sugar epimerase